MTVAYTARKQHKSVLAFFAVCCAATRDDAAPPSLFGTAAAD